MEKFLLEKWNYLEKKVKNICDVVENIYICSMKHGINLKY